MLYVISINCIKLCIKEFFISNKRANNVYAMKLRYVRFLTLVLR